MAVPGHTVLVMHLRPGRAAGKAEPILPAVKVNSLLNEDRWSAQLTVPDESMQRCDVLLIARQGRPEVRINGEVFQPGRTNTGRGWQIAALDLQKWRGKEIEIDVRSEPKTGSPAQIEAWLILDRSAATSTANSDPRL